jgi:hypothetical protein
VKRTSIKGLGEALFFEYDRQSDIPAAETGPLTQVPTFVHPDVAAPPIPDILTSISADVTAASPDVPTFGRPEALTPERPDIRTSAEDDERPDASWQIPLDMRKRLRAVLREERRIHTTVRFSPDEMAALRDLVYQMEAKMGIKITRNEVMRIALHFFLEDYERRKKESLLLQVLEEIDE